MSNPYHGIKFEAWDNTRNPTILSGHDAIQLLHETISRALFIAGEAQQLLDHLQRGPIEDKAAMPGPCEIFMDDTVMLLEAECE